MITVSFGRFSPKMVILSRVSFWFLILEHLYEFNIADLRIEELVQLITEKDFMFLKMKIENNGDKQGESPNPYPLSYLTK